MRHFGLKCVAIGLWCKLNDFQVGPLMLLCHLLLFQSKSDQNPVSHYLQYRYIAKYVMTKIVN